MFVSGSVVTSGFYSATNESLGNFLQDISFSSDIYPFYAIYETIDASGLVRSRVPFALSDPKTYSELKASSNTKIYFLSREEALGYSEEKLLNELEEDERKAFTIDEKNEAQKRLLQLPRTNQRTLGENSELIKQDLIDPNNMISISLPNESLRIPVKGKVSPKQLHLFLGISSEIDEDKVSIVTVNDSFTDVYNEIIDADSLVAVSFPSARNEQLIEVEIRGEINSSGTYLVSSSTTLSDLYVLAGGFKNNAFEDGIFIAREDVKTRQSKAIKEAKAILTDAIIQKSNSLSEQGTIDIEAILALSNLVQPDGRVAGNFSKNSETANSFILKDGDVINIPPLSNEVIVQGEVLNSSSFVFEEGLNYLDYVAVAGGFSDYADKRGVFIIKANGLSVTTGSSLFSGQVDIEPGDTIVVPRNLDQLEALPLISMATKIIADIAFSAASLNAISD